MSSAKKLKRQKKKDKKRNSIEQQIKSTRLSSAYECVVKIVQSTACSVYNGTERVVNTCVVNPIYWTANSVFHVTTAPLRLGFFMFDYMICQLDEELPVKNQDPQVEESTRQLIRKLEQRVQHLEYDVKRLSRKKSLSPACPSIEESSLSVPLPPIFTIPPPPPPPPMSAPPLPLKFTITKKSHSESVENKPTQLKHVSMPAVSLHDISNVKLKRVSITNSNNKKPDDAHPDISTLRKPLVPLQRKPPSPKGLASITMKLRKVEKSPGGTPMKLARVVPLRQSPKQLSTSPTIKNIKHPVNDENTPVNTNVQIAQLITPIKQPHDGTHGDFCLTQCTE